jgi:hypothetical protein
MINGCIFDLFGVILKGISPDESKSFDPKLLSPDDLTDGFFVFLKELVEAREGVLDFIDISLNFLGSARFGRDSGGW